MKRFYLISSGCTLFLLLLLPDLAVIATAQEESSDAHLYTWRSKSGHKLDAEFVDLWLKTTQPAQPARAESYVGLRRLDAEGGTIKLRLDELTPETRELMATHGHGQFAMTFTTKAGESFRAHVTTGGQERVPAKPAIQAECVTLMRKDGGVIEVPLSKLTSESERLARQLADAQKSAINVWWTRDGKRIRGSVVALRSGVVSEGETKRSVLMVTLKEENGELTTLPKESLTSGSQHRVESSFASARELATARESERVAAARERIGERPPTIASEVPRKPADEDGIGTLESGLVRLEVAIREARITEGEAQIDKQLAAAMTFLNNDEKSAVVRGTMEAIAFTDRPVSKLSEAYGRDVVFKYFLLTSSQQVILVRRRMDKNSLAYEDAEKLSNAWVTKSIDKLLSQ